MKDCNGEGKSVESFVLPRLERFAVWILSAVIMYGASSYNGMLDRMSSVEKDIIVLTQDKISRVEMQAFEDRLMTQIHKSGESNKRDVSEMKQLLVERMDLILRSLPNK